MKFLLFLCLRLGLTALLLRVIGEQFPGYFSIGGGTRGLLTVAFVLTALNIAVRPLFRALTLPVRLVSGIFGGILVNIAFLIAALKVMSALGPSFGTLTIGGSFGAWIVAAFLLSLTQFIP